MRLHRFGHFPPRRPAFLAAVFCNTCSGHFLSSADLVHRFVVPMARRVFHREQRVYSARFLSENVFSPPSIKINKLASLRADPRTPRKVALPFLRGTFFDNGYTCLFPVTSGTLLHRSNKLFVFLLPTCAVPLFPGFSCPFSTAGRDGV